MIPLDCAMASAHLSFLTMLATISYTVFHKIPPHFTFWKSLIGDTLASVKHEQNQCQEDLAMITLSEPWFSEAWHVLHRE